MEKEKKEGKDLPSWESQVAFFIIIGSALIASTIGLIVLLLR